MTDPKLLRRLVERYYANKATPEELAVFVHLQKTEVLDEILDEFLEEKIHQAIEEFSGSKRKIIRLNSTVRWAASVSILIFCSYLAFNFNKISGQTKYVKVHTNKYQEKNITLADGSLVTLNRNSEFTYPVKWTGNSREVKLVSGEAYFQVRKNKEHQSFVVHLPDGVDIQVLGTHFNVTSRRGESSIYLESGAVNVNRDGHESLLKPGQLAQCVSDNQSVIVSDVNGEAWLAWKNNMFFFDDTPLTEVGKALEDFYHKKVIIESKTIAGLRFTGKVSRSDMAMVLRILSSTLQIDIVQRNNQIIIEDTEEVFAEAD